MKQSEIDFYPKKNILAFPKFNRVPALEYRHMYTVGARSAIYVFLKSNSTDKAILVPSYNCGKEIEAIIASGHNIAPYKITDKLEIDLKVLQTMLHSGAFGYILITHFFGHKDPQLQKIIDLCKAHKIGVIEDYAHCFIGEDFEPAGDVAVFSLRKFYPTKHLGLLILAGPKHKLLYLRKKQKNQDKTFGAIKGIYGYSMNIFQILSFRFSNNNEIKKKRLRNSQFLATELGDCAGIRKSLFAYKLDHTPNVPEYLRAIKIINFWDKFHPKINWEDYPESACDKRNTKILSINQDYDYGKKFSH